LSDIKYGIRKVTAIKRFRLQVKHKQSKIKGKDHNSQTQFYKDTAVVTQLYYQVCITYQHQLHVSAIAAVVIFRLYSVFYLLYLLEGVDGVFVGKPGGRRPLERPKRRWVDNIRMDLQEVGCGYMDWIGLAQDRDRWQTLVSAVMNLGVP
jgi:hypothetical protein